MIRAVRLVASIGRLVVRTSGCLLAVFAVPSVLASDYPNPTQETGMVDLLVLGDFNGDGHPDAVLGRNLTTRDLRLVPGTGDGTFGPPATIQTGVWIGRLATADFDRDGRLDFVAFAADSNFGQQSNTRVQLFRGRGDGTFDPPVVTLVSSSVGVSARDMAVADLDGNGAPDVIVLNDGGYMNLCRLLNSGAGALSPAACQSWAGDKLQAADFNEDGRPDVAIENGGGILVLFGTGSGPFSGTASVVSNVPIGIGMIGVADVNQDGHADILYVPYAANGAVTSAAGIVTGNGAGGFSSPVTVPGASCCSGIGVADVDGDGVLDIVTAGSWQISGLIGGITIDPGLAGGGFGPARLLQTGGSVRSMALGFLDSDARVDLVTGVGPGSNYSSLGGLRSYLGTPDGRFGMTSLGAGASTDAASADLNGDGHTDLVVVESVNNRISVFLSNGNGTFAAPLSSLYGSSPSGLALGDFNGDGRIDAVTGLSPGLALLLGNGDGTLAPPISLPGGALHTHVVAGDFNGDGRLDVAAINSLFYPSALSIFINIDNNGTFEIHGYPSGYNPVALATGDVDGDGVLDLLLGSIPYSGGTVPFPWEPKRPGILHGHGDGAFDPPAYLTWTGFGNEISSVLIADLNGDGISDLAVGTKDFGGSVGVYLGQGLGAFGPSLFPPSGTAPIAALAAIDFDGDDRLDLVVGNQASADIAILSIDGTGSFLPPVRFGTLTPASIATGDFNTDGKIDFALATPEAVATVVLSRGATAHDPIADAGPDRTGECGAAVLLDGSGSTDADSTPGTSDDIVLFSWYENYGQPSQVALGTGPALSVPFTLGLHAVTLQVTDSTGRTGTDDVTVTMVDALAPTGSVILLPGALWPPNHRMIDVTAHLTAVDQCGGPVTVTLDSVTSNEPDDAPGGADGTTTGDIAGVSPGTFDTQFSLRAERAAAGPGRVYTVSYRLADASGHQAVVIGTVSVPHDNHGITDPITLQVLPVTGGDALIAWNAIEGASHYDVVAGALSSLVNLDPAAGEPPPACMANRIPPDTTSFRFTGDPEPGTAFFFLVDYVSYADATNGPSGYGSDSGPYDLQAVVPVNICP